MPSPSQQDDERNRIIEGIARLPRIEAALLGGLDAQGQWEEGILGRLKRLEEKETARDKERDRRYSRETGLWIAVAGLAIKEIWTWMRSLGQP